MSNILPQPDNVQYQQRSCSTDAWLGSVAHLMRSPRTIPRALWGALGPYEEPLRLVPSEKRGAAAAQPQPQPTEDDLGSAADGLQQEVRPQRCWATGKQKYSETDTPGPSEVHFVILLVYHPAKQGPKQHQLWPIQTIAEIHPLSSTFILFSPFHPLSSTYIHFHPL